MVSQDSFRALFVSISHGDTRGRRDGTAIQYEHSLIIDSMLGQIKKLQSTEYPVRFVLQSGDAVQHGQNAKEWNVSFTPLIDRLTTEENVPYFLAPGNHDVSSALTVDAAQRGPALKNYFDVVSELIPRDGSAHRLAGTQRFRLDMATRSCWDSTQILRGMRSSLHG